MDNLQNNNSAPISATISNQNTNNNATTNLAQKTVSTTSTTNISASAVNNMTNNNSTSTNNTNNFVKREYHHSTFRPNYNNNNYTRRYNNHMSGEKQVVSVSNQTNNSNIQQNNNTLNNNNLGEYKPFHKYPNKNKLKVIFLGGVGEIGKNMTALEYGNDIIIIDAGLAFPDDDMLGIDVVVPDISYLISNKDKIRGMVLTHGHEDHIGALPYVLGDLDMPLYGSRFTMALVDNKMREFPKIKYKSNVVTARSSVKLGCFSVEFIEVNHSIPGAFALAISTPVGMVIHSGDFKVDYTPVSGNTTDLARLAELGNKGVKLLLCESTNVEKPGFTMSEKTVGVTIDKLLDQYSDKRIFIATFASNVQRLQQILDLAVKYKRKVAFSGRSMLNVTDIAIKLGEMSVKSKENIIDIENIGNYADKELLIITTGSQGEPMSALTRMACGSFPKININSNDCIIMSSSPIPGNEKSIYNVINALYKEGATVIYHELADVHVSGHACQQELKLMHELTKPKFFIPVHGEYRHLKIHQNMAMEMGMKERDTVIADLGDVVEVGENSISLAGKVPAGQRLIDGTGESEVDSVVLRDRKQLSEEGVCVTIVNLSSLTGEVIGQPEMISRGFIYNDEVNVINEAKAIVIKTVAETDVKVADRLLIKNNIKKALSAYFFKKTMRRPMILTIIMQN
jgi:ribonuclease J